MKLARAAVCLLACGAAARAQRSPLPPEQLTAVRGVLDAIYRLDFAAAEARCRRMIAARPDDAAGQVYLARTYWQQVLVRERALTVDRFTQPDFFVERPPVQLAADAAAAQRFRQASQAAIQQAEAAARRRPRDPAALFLLGAAHQNEASFLLAVNREWWAAILAGSHSERAHRELLALDRGYADALLVTGLFHYTVGALPWNIRWIPLLLGYHGKKAAGEREIEQAAARGQLVADDARALLAVLYAIDGRTPAALARLEELRARYPENYLTQLDIAGIRLRAGQPAAAIEICRGVLARMERTAGPPLLERGIVWNQLGIASRAAGHAAEAERWLRATLADGAATPQTRALAHLELGKTLDAAGRRGEARGQYEQARHAGHAGARAEAERFLRRPYQGR